MITFSEFLDESLARLVLKGAKAASRVMKTSDGTGRRVASSGRLKQLTTGPSRSRVGLDRQRANASERAAFRRSGMRRTQPGGTRQRFTSTNDKNQYSKTAITSYPSQSAYAKDVIPTKEKEQGVRSTQDRALFLRRLRRQIKTTRTPRGVHAVDILPKGDYKKNDPTELMSRGKEYHRAVQDIPQEVQNAGGKKGDKISGKAAEVMIGSKNPEQGRRKRRALYSKALGATEWDPITKVQIANVKEEITFQQFLESAQRKEYEETRHEDDTYQTVQQKLQNPRLTRLIRLLNREQGRYTV